MPAFLAAINAINRRRAESVSLVSRLPFLCGVLFMSFNLNAQDTARDELSAYVQSLKQSKASGGKATAFLSAGSYFLNAQQFFEDSNYFAAANYFKDALNRDSTNPFTNYMLGLSILKQKDSTNSSTGLAFLNTAFQARPSLKIRYVQDLQSVTVVKAPVMQKTDQPPLTLSGTPPAAAVVMTPAQVQPRAAPVVAVVHTPDIPLAVAPTAADELDDYVAALKYSYNVGDKETAPNTHGELSLKAIYCFEASDFACAELNFRVAMARKYGTNAFNNYLLSLCMLARGKESEMISFREQSFEQVPLLRNRYQADSAQIASGKSLVFKPRRSVAGGVKKAKPGNAVKSVKETYPALPGKATKLQEVPAPPAAPAPVAAKPLATAVKSRMITGLKFGNYLCSEAIKGAAGITLQPKGNFELNKDGTYTWLGNGVAGTYDFDAATGTIRWLSGYFKTIAAGSSTYQLVSGQAGILLRYADNTETHEWKCACEILNK